MHFLHMPTLTEHAERKLSSAGDPYLWRQMKADIVAGRAQLFSCPDDTYVVLALADDALILVAVVGSNGVEVVRAVLEIARVRGLPSIRFQTARRGAARLLREFNPVPLQTIFRITVNEN